MNKRIAIRLVSITLLTILSLFGCVETNGTSSEETIIEGWLGEKYDTATEIGIQQAGDHVYLQTCPIDNGTLSLPTIFAQDTVINGVSDHSFTNNNEIVTLIIPDCYEYIGISTFKNCENLEIVFIGKNVNYIGELSFNACPKLSRFELSEENPYFYVSDGCVLEKETNILLATNGTVPACTKIIGPSVFAANKQISNLTLPNGLKQISPLAFNGSSIKHIVLPESLTSIGWSSFNYCSELKEIYIPIGVSEIGENAFAHTKDLAIYCEAESKPDGWSEDWLAGSENVTVVWGSPKK